MNLFYRWMFFLFQEVPENTNGHKANDGHDDGDKNKLGGICCLLFNPEEAEVRVGTVQGQGADDNGGKRRCQRNQIGNNPVFPPDELIQVLNFLSA